MGAAEKPEKTMSLSERRVFLGRNWKRLDVVKASTFFFVHFLCLLAPFHFNRRALRLALVVCTVGGLGIMASYRGNLAHRSFKLPKWLEYLFAYCGLLALQGDPIDWVSIHRFTDTDRDPDSPIEGFWFSHIPWLFDAAYCGRRSNVEDLKRQWFYRFLRRTVIFHVLGFGVLLYSWGGFPFLAWGMGAGIVLEYHVTYLINSLCHVPGNRPWRTPNVCSFNPSKVHEPRLMKNARLSSRSEEGEDYSMGKTSLNEKMIRKRRPYFRRQWKRIDVIRTMTVGSSHLLCLLAPFHFTWEALRLSLILYPVASLGITLSYHRNLAHRSFKLPKWLEYLFAYIGLFALQGDPIDWVSIHRFHHQFTDSERDPHSPLEGFWFSHFIWIFDTEYIREKCGGRNNVGDLKQQWFYRFLQRTLGLHVLGFSTILYFWGGFPCVAWGMGVDVTFGYHTTWLINSACHIWGSRAWKTNDTSRNVWWLSVFSSGESWHNNHHAFGSSARHGLEWWQIDFTWYVIRFLEAVGLATDVKLPTESQKQRMALIH